MKTISEITAAVHGGELKAAAIARETAGAIEETSELNAVLNWSRELLEAEAAAVDRGERPGALAGVPLAVKDNISTVDQPTTCGSRILENYVSPYDSTAVRKLREAGAILGVKTNLDEFAMGSSTEHSAFGRVLHPLDHDRVPGGSSGGSAALVAAGVVPAALGSETGGSVRQPASFCGVVGVKPGYGRVSRYGLVAFGSSLDCISVFGRTVDDAARVLCVISGRDDNDATTVDAPPISLPNSGTTMEGLTIGLPGECFTDQVDPGVRAACDRAIETIKGLGAKVVEVSLPHTPYAVATYYVIAPAEASSNLARYDGVRYGLRGEGADVRSLYRATRGQGFGTEVRRRIVIGTYVLSAGYYEAYYGRAQKIRTLIARDFERVFDDSVDYLFTPTTPTTAFKAGERTADPVQMYLADVFTCGASLAGIPALSLPIGRCEGLPVGGQLIGPPLSESGLLAAAAALESAVDAEAEVAP